MIVSNDIQKFYIAYYGRPADPTGLSYWLSTAESATSSGSSDEEVLASISNTFASSSDFTAIISGLDNDGIVELVYQNLFSHSADSSGLLFWSAALGRGDVTIAQVVRVLIDGPTGLDADALTSKIAAAGAFTTALDTTSEILGYSGSVANDLAKTWLSGISDAATLSTAIETSALDATVTAISTPSPTLVISTSDSALIIGETSALTFTLSEASSNFSAADISVAGGVLSDFTALSSTVYTASFTPTPNSTATATVDVAGGSFTNVAGNGNTAASQLSMTVDTIAPTIVIATNDNVLTVGESATLTFTLSEPSSNFSAADISEAGGVLSDFTALSSTVYTASFTPTPNSTATATVDVADGSFSDAAGNGNTAASQLSMTVDTVVTAGTNVINKTAAGNLPSNPTTLGDATHTGTGKDIITIFAPSSLAISNTINGQADTDEIRFTSTTAGQTLTLGAGVTNVEHLTIGTGTADTAITTATTALNVNASAVLTGLTITGNDGNNTITGTKEADTINAGAGNNTIKAGDGNNVITSGAGKDAITGGAGNDSIVAGNGNDTINSGNGIIGDTVSGGSGDTVLGGDGKDSITAGSGNDLLDGGNGRDTINGAAGNDTILGGAGNDSLTGGDGNDSITGGYGSDVMIGGTGKADNIGIDTFMIGNDGLGSDTINDFSYTLDADGNAGLSDRLIITGHDSGGAVGFDSTDFTLSFTSANNSGVTINFKDGGSVLLKGINFDDLYFDSGTHTFTLTDGGGNL